MQTMKLMVPKEKPQDARIKNIPSYLELVNCWEQRGSSCRIRLCPRGCLGGQHLQSFTQWLSWKPSPTLVWGAWEEEPHPRTILQTGLSTNKTENSCFEENLQVCSLKM